MSKFQYSEDAHRIHNESPLTLDEAQSLVDRYKEFACFDDIVKVGLMTDFWPDPAALRNL